MKFAPFFILLLILTSFTLNDGFLAEQKRFARVKSAFLEKGRIVDEMLIENGLRSDDLQILFVTFKAEQQLDVYAKSVSDSYYIRIHSYSICQSSVRLGPKQRQGDMLIPEGFYYISKFNPTSNFHLSLGINYPNLSDRRRSSTQDLGGDIYIHGSCVSAGCIPMTDDAIKEIYLFALHAKNCDQQNIPVYIFPFKMTDQNNLQYSQHYNNNPELIKFWTNLKEGFDKFEANKKELKVFVDDDGNYLYF